MKSFVALGLLLLVATSAPRALAKGGEDDDDAPLPVPAVCNIKYGGFGQSVAFIEAEARGFFAEQGLKVCYTQVMGSMPQFNALYAGQYDIISTTTDNSINRFVNQLDTFNGSKAPPIQIVSAASQGPELALWSVESAVPTLADVAGKTITVDAATSGLVFTVRKLLAVKAGLTVPAYNFSGPSGGTGQRLELLSNGSAVLTALFAPFSNDAATRPGLKELGRVSDAIDTLQLDGLTTLRSFGTQEPGASLLPRFLAALIKGGRYARKASHRQTVVADIAAVYPVRPEAFLDAILDPVTGENIDLAMNFEGLKTAIELRKEFGGFGAKAATVNSTALVVPAADGLFNDVYLKEALSLVKKAKKEKEPKKAKKANKKAKKANKKARKHGGRRQG